MTGTAFEGRDGGLLRKYTKILPKRLGKDTKNPLPSMIYCSNSNLVLPNTSRTRQRSSQISRRVILVHN